MIIIIKRPVILVIPGLFILSFLIHGCSSDQSSITAFEKAQDTVPLRDNWEKAIPFQEIPEGLASLSSEDCGKCHIDHYKEWQYSTHSHAWTDPQFQAEIKKETSPYSCINCHAPLENQQEYIYSGLIGGDIYNPAKTVNKGFDKNLRNEGINCASCHVRDGFVIGPTGSTKAPHPVKKDSDHLSEKLCFSCHNVSETINPNLVCSFETGNEWMASNYNEKGKNCISCHMPDTVRSIVPGFEPRQSRFHFFPGSGIPKFADQPTKMLNGLDITVHNFSANFIPGESRTFTVELANNHAGHKVPTGDPERFILVSFSLRKADSSVIDEKVFRIGEEWEWYPEAKKLSDNNIMPGERRLFEYNPEEIPAETDHIRIVVTKHRTTAEVRDYHNIDPTYPISITIFREVHKLIPDGR